MSCAIPLAPIRNALELMRRAGHDATMTDRALAIMERQVQQLVRLTDDLSTYRASPVTRSNSGTTGSICGASFAAPSKRSSR